MHLLVSRALVVAAATAFAAGRASAGDWHVDDGLLCSECHTAHNSAGGAPMRYDASPAVVRNLLRAADEVSLCLYCHDGSRAGAPDVLAPVGYVGDPAAGAFRVAGDAAPGAHDLAAPSPVAVPGGTLQLVLTCSSCHDPHGNGNYRNLRDHPGGLTGAAPAVTVDQVKRASGTNAAEVYATSNLTYRSGLSAWCLDCHDRLAGSHWHPWDRAIAGAPLASWTTWSGTQAFPRVPVDNPTDPAVPSADDAVTCVSCHPAHGSGNAGMMRYANGLDESSTCLQCHVQSP